jgi:guanylate kinase
MFDLAARLRSRGTEDPETVDRRLQVAESELAARDEFDAALVNTDVGETVQALLDLIDTPPG